MAKKQKSEHLYLDIFSEKNSKFILWVFVAVYCWIYLIYPHKGDSSIDAKIIAFFIKHSSSIAFWSFILTYIIAIRPYGGGLFKTIWFYIMNILDFSSKVKKSIYENKKEGMKKREKLIHAFPIIVLNLGLIMYFFTSMVAVIFGPNRYTVTFESSFAIAIFILCFLYTKEMLNRHNHYPFEVYKLNRKSKRRVSK